jgi:hypothetical protein
MFLIGVALFTLTTVFGFYFLLFITERYRNGCSYLLTTLRELVSLPRVLPLF